VLELKTLGHEINALRDVLMNQGRMATDGVAPSPDGLATLVPAPSQAMDEVTDFLFRKLQYPLVRDLMLYYDRVAKSAADAEVAASIEDLRATVGSFRDEIGDLLREHGVEPIEAVGRYIDSELHQQRAVVQTRNRELHEQIARVMRHGFMGNGSVLRKAEVEVYKYNAEALS
jgi:hypothetical protein